MFEGVTKIAEQDRQSLFEAVDYIDKQFFKGSKYIAGSDAPTLGDVTLLASIATFVVSFLPIYICILHIYTAVYITNLLMFPTQSIGGDLKNYPNIAAWYDLCKDLPGNVENLAGAKQFGDAVKSKLEDAL